jgi:FAD dependent oxidoreductase
MITVQAGVARGRPRSPGAGRNATMVRVTDDATITIYEPARAVDVVHRVPVLVVGGGPSGLAAAIAAARAGAEVSLLERFGCRALSRGGHFPVSDHLGTGGRRFGLGRALDGREPAARC